MAHFAEINENNEVIYVVYMDNEIIIDENGNEIEQLGIDHLHLHHGSHRRWVKTSYNGNFRGKYAGIEDAYREDLDLFISPSPYPSWILNETTGEWEAQYLILMMEVFILGMKNLRFGYYKKIRYNIVKYLEFEF